MGYRAILSLVSALSVGQILSAEFRYGYGKAGIVAAFGNHRLGNTALLRGASRINRAMIPSLGFIAGVMHDIGKAGLNTDLGQDPQAVSSEMGKAKGTGSNWRKACAVSTTPPWEPFW